MSSGLAATGHFTLLSPLQSVIYIRTIHMLYIYIYICIYDDMMINKSIAINHQPINNIYYNIYYILYNI